MNAKQLKNALLQHAIQGRLVPQDPGDEPANILLQRIRAEKEQLIKEGKIKKQKPLPPITEEEKPFAIPDSWQWVRLGEIIKNVGYGTAKKSQKSGSIPVIRMGNIKDGHIDYTNLVFSDDYSEIKKYKLYLHDLLFNRTNSTDLVGKVAIYEGDRDAIFAGYLVRFQSIIVDPYYINYTMQTPYYNHFCSQVKTLGVSQANINAEKLKSFIFPLPPLAEQQRIVARLEELLPDVEAYGTAQERLTALESSFPQQLRKSLLQEAIQGRLVPQDPADESADVLLQRIRAEKEQLIKEGKIKKQKPLPPITEEEKPFAIPDSWQWVRLGTLLFSLAIKAISSDTGNTWLLELEDIEKESGKLLRRSLTKNKEFGSTKNKFTTGNILYSKLRPYLNKVIIADRDGYCTSEIIPFDFRFGIAQKYAKYVLMSPYFVNYAVKKSYGVKMPRLGTYDMHNALLPLPPLAEQQRIVARLEELLPLCDGLLSAGGQA